MGDTKFDISLTKDTVSFVCNTLADLRMAIRRLRLGNKRFTHYTGLMEPLTDEHSGILFLSSKPNGAESDEYNTFGDLAVKGDTLAQFLEHEFKHPVIALYQLTPGAKLGGWELSGQVNGDDWYLRADRVLFGSDKKAN